ncbi:MAG TPA: PAS domain S-box protein [Vitreimonas sp.]|uniref:PAS domain S-box protein n=1 Tax=Vitreimonas sp. TaxID=3069702 RepID=UPI002D6F41C6|nr:PAS domain S-box protein [Vitreimonas sp.]HYD88175.1 PAS domain S-box protein [Vitreimonas sp.]
MPTQHQRFLEALSAAVYTTDAEGRITFYNSAASKLWGRNPELGELWCGSWRIYKPDGTPLPHDECPMAMCLKQGGEVRGVEAVAERPDGSRVPFMPYPTPLHDEDGKLTGAINLLVDLSDLHQAEIERAKLAAIVESSDDAIVSKTLQGVVTSWNASAERIFGYSASEMIGQHITKIIPPELHSEESRILSELAAGKRIEHYETVREAKDGRRVHVSLTVSPIRNGRGEIVGASKVGRDITERKRAEEAQHLLMNELNHRVKNTLATVDAISRQTLRRAANPREFSESFGGRLRALSRANSLLTAASIHGSEIAHGAEISEIIASQLSFGDGGDNRITWRGPIVTLSGQAALHLALVLHELGTNARKYGALSTPSGKVAIEWVVESQEVRDLLLSWRESGGPRVTAPETRGFGTTLIEQSLKSHGGVVTMEYAATGVACTIKLPLAQRLDEFALVSRFEATAPAQAAVKPGVADRRILVVEDETLIAMVLVDYLEEAGCQVVGPAATVEAALGLVDAGDIDAALLDGNLAGQRVDGIAAALTKKGVPFAFVTGYGREALPTAFREAVIVEKPFSQKQCVAALERILSSGGANVVDLKKRS